MQNCSRGVGIALILVVAVSAGADTPVLPPSVTDATTQYQKAAEQADAVWKQAMLVAKRTYLQALDKALKSALVSAKLDEANQIKAIKQNIEVEIDALAKGKEICRVSANQHLQKFGTYKKGEKLRFVARGQWCVNRSDVAGGTTGPDGMLVDGKGLESNGVLEGRIGKQSFQIGKECEIVVDEDGLLEMGPHDTGVSDNYGAVGVAIERVSSSPPNPSTP